MKTNLIVVTFVVFLIVFAVYVAVSEPYDQDDKVNQQQLQMQQSAFSQQQQDTLARYTSDNQVMVTSVISTSSPQASQIISDVKVNVTIKSGKVDPQEIIIRKGTTVIWQNQDMNLHTITSNTVNGKLILADLKSSPMRQGDDYYYTFNASGSYAYVMDDNAHAAGEIKVVE